jgi:hypothetical protein
MYSVEEIPPSNFCRLKIVVLYGVMPLPEFRLNLYYIVLCVYGTQSLSVREEHKLRVFENKV